MYDLLAHHLPPTDRAAQRPLVHDHPQRGRVVALKNLLPLQARGNLVVDFSFRRAKARLEYGPRILLGLQKARDQHRLEPAEFLGLPFARYPVLEPGGVGLVTEAVADLFAEAGQGAVGGQGALQVVGHFGGGDALAQLDGLN